MLTVLKIIDVKHRPTRKTLDLSVDIKEGDIAKDMVIFLRYPILGRSEYLIKAVKRPFFSNKIMVRVQVADLPEWAKGSLEESIKENLGKDIFCGLSFLAYQECGRIKKEQYFKAFVERFTKGDLQNFYLSNIRLGLRLIPVEENSQLSLSKIGGHPLADSEFEWPVGRNQEPCLFIGQVNLAEISLVFETAKEVGFDGVLYYFGTVSDDDGYLSFGDIIIKSSPVPIDPVKIPLLSNTEAYGVFAEKYLNVAELVTVPADESCLHDFGSIFSEESMYAQSVFTDYLSPEGFNLIGHPEQVQGCLLRETEMRHKKMAWYNSNLGKGDEEQIKKEREIASANCKDWRLIFSIDMMHYNFRKLSNLEKEFNQYMDGLYSIMIREDDLRKGIFDNIQTVYTCT